MSEMQAKMVDHWEITFWVISQLLMGKMFPTFNTR